MCQIIHQSSVSNQLSAELHSSLKFSQLGQNNQNFFWHNDKPNFQQHVQDLPAE